MIGVIKRTEDTEKEDLLIRLMEKENQNFIKFDGVQTYKNQKLVLKMSGGTHPNFFFTRNRSFFHHGKDMNFKAFSLANSKIMIRFRLQQITLIRYRLSLGFLLDPSWYILFFYSFCGNQFFFDFQMSNLKILHILIWTIVFFKTIIIFCSILLN